MEQSKHAATMRASKHHVIKAGQISNLGIHCGEKVSSISQRAESILRGMDELLVDLVDFEPRTKPINSPEREVHIDEGRHGLVHNSHKAGLVDHPSDLLPSKLYHSVPVPSSSMPEQRRNPENTAPPVTENHGSADCSSRTKRSEPFPLREPIALTVELTNSFLLGDDDSEVSLLLDGEEASPSAPMKWSMGDDDEPIECIQDAVDAIREEAAKVEAALAIDKLQTLQSELRSMTKLLQAQAEQIDHLKTEVKSKDKALAVLELERDLCRADIEALLEFQRLSASNAFKRIDVHSPMDSLTAASVSSKGPEVDQSFGSGATLASSGISTEGERNVCEVDIGSALQKMRRNSESIGTLRLDVDSPLASVSSGGSTQLERYLCNVNALQEGQETNPRSPIEVPIRSITLASKGGGTSHASMSDIPARGIESEHPSMEQEGKHKAPTKLVQHGSAGNKKNMPPSKEEMRLVPLTNRQETLTNEKMGAMTIPAAPKPLSAAPLVERSSGNGTVHGDKATSRNRPEDGSHHSSSQGSSHGSSKENRVMNRKKKPSQFKPIHPGKEQLIPPQKLHVPIPRKILSVSWPTPTTVAVTDFQSSDDSQMSGMAIPSGTGTTNIIQENPQPSTQSPTQGSERRLFGKSKVDKSGAFPTEDPTKNSRNYLVDKSSNSGTKRVKSGASIFRPKKSCVNEGRDCQMQDLPTKRHSVASRCLEGRDSLQTQVEELSQRLRTSVEGSEDLRKRLAMISRYYETTVHRLSDNIVSLKKEQATMQGDLTKQIRNIDRERLVAIKRTELLLKEQQIAKFKRKQKHRY